MSEHTWTWDEVRAWFVGRLPDDWFVEVTVRGDRDEILVTGRVPEPAVGDDADQRAVAARSRIEGVREQTREARIAIAADAERRWGRKVSWAVVCGDIEQRFTTASVPVMTRLRLDERRVLDTLIDAGVARSRSDALGWCVRLVGRHQGEWIDQLRAAMEHVEKVRAEGPEVA
ncbi:MAG TPA: hypothetical protein VK866_16090 [Acidimicrobiales bacterium]|nr:hypothetical protein [Acidimicrobiales bacterium]